MPVRLTRGRLDVAAVARTLEASRQGGEVVFAGRVRPDRRGRRRVVALDYEVDPAPALRQLRALEQEARRRFGVRTVVLAHRTGRVAVGEVAVVVGVSAPHRAEAFAAARYLIDTLKREVPIWKTEWTGPTARAAGRRPTPPVIYARPVKRR